MFALAGALDAVLALDGQMLAKDHAVHDFAAGDRFTIGPFHLVTRSLQHFLPNVGVRIEVDGLAIA